MGVLGEGLRGLQQLTAHPSPQGRAGAQDLAEPAGQGHPPDSQQKLGQPMLPTYVHSPHWGMPCPGPKHWLPPTPNPCQ